MVAGITGTRARAERLTREVNTLVEKKPTVSLPSALEVLRTKVGDCNEHTALFVALARSLGIPARINVGLVYVRGAFYYHAWPEVYIDEGKGQGLWLPVDPTFNQFPADATHVRLARGGLDKQAAILPMIGKTQDVRVATSRWRRTRRRSWSAGRRAIRVRWRSTFRAGRRAAAGRRPAPEAGDDRRRESRQALRQLHRGRRRVAERRARTDPRLPRPERRRQDDEHPHHRRAAEADARAASSSTATISRASPKRRRRRSASFPIARSSTRS